MSQQHLEKNGLMAVILSKKRQFYAQLGCKEDTLLIYLLLLAQKLQVYEEPTHHQTSKNVIPKAYLNRIFKYVNDRIHITALIVHHDTPLLIHNSNINILFYKLAGPIRPSQVDGSILLSFVQSKFIQSISDS